MLSTSETLILAVIQGLTEFLPVSSSGHLSLASDLFGLKDSSVQISILLHVATALATLVFFRKIIFSLLTDVLTRSKPALNYTLSLTIASVITGVAGYIFMSYARESLDSLLVAGLGFLITTAEVIGISKLHIEETEANTYPTLRLQDSILLGIFQSIALVPGISRSGSTIFISKYLGLHTKHAFETSFLLSIPAIFGALLLEMIDSPDFHIGPPEVGAFSLAFFVGIAALYALQSVLKFKKIYYLGMYTGVLGVVTLYLALF